MCLYIELFANFYIIYGKNCNRCVFWMSLNNIGIFLEGIVNTKMAQDDEHFHGKGVSKRNKAYYIVYSNVFDTFIYYGQQCAFL